MDFDAYGWFTTAHIVLGVDFERLNLLLAYINSISRIILEKAAKHLSSSKDDHEMKNLKIELERAWTTNDIEKGPTTCACLNEASDIRGVKLSPNYSLHKSLPLGLR